MKKISNSRVGDIRKEFMLGNLTEDEAYDDLYNEVGDPMASKLIEKWKPGVLKSSINSSVDKAVSAAEDYFGTLAENNTIVCQDIITFEDSKEIKKIAEDNNVKVKIGQYSVTFYDSEEYLEKFTNEIESSNILGEGKLIQSVFLIGKGKWTIEVNKGTKEKTDSWDLIDETCEVNNKEPVEFNSKEEAMKSPIFKKAKMKYADVRVVSDKDVNR